MEKFFNKPCFEIIFGISIILIFTLPALEFGQNNRPIEITINHNDTVFKRKELLQILEADHLQALKEIKAIGLIIANWQRKKALFNQ